jgi:hypothetical protein
MTCFVGLDVSQKMTAVCVIDNAGRRCPTVPEQINILVRRHAGDDARIGIETGAMTPWLVHELRTLGREAICLDARHARAALEMQINKTDQNDAEGLAQIVRTGWYRSVHVKSFDSHRARALLGARTQLIGMTTRLSNHIRGVLKTFGLLPGAMRGLPFDRKVEALLGAPFADFLCALADGPFGFRILLTLRADYFNLDESLQQLRSRLWADGQDAVFRLRRNIVAVAGQRIDWLRGADYDEAVASTHGIIVTTAVLPPEKSKNARGFGSGLYNFIVDQHAPSFPEFGGAPPA